MFSVGKRTVLFLDHYIFFSQQLLSLSSSSVCATLIIVCGITSPRNATVWMGFFMVNICAMNFVVKCQDQAIYSGSSFCGSEFIVSCTFEDH